MNPPLGVWVAGARPRTLPAAVVPVAVGTAAGYLTSGQLVVIVTRASQASHSTLGISFDRRLSWLNAVLALVVALGIQVGTNYVNDYADGVRGTDERRVGPVRLVAGGLATARQVKVAALVAFGVAGVAGLFLAARVTWWLLPVGLVCALAGWAYTGGPRPYGYLGFGELFVFVFFGLVATTGSAYVQHAPFEASGSGFGVSHGFDWGFALWAGVPVGLLAAALLEANNLRDIATDTVSGKRTLAVRLGRRRAGLLYVGTLAAAGISVAVLAGYRRGRSGGPGCRPARRSSSPPGAGRPGGARPAAHAWHHGTPAAGCRRPADRRLPAVSAEVLPGAVWGCPGLSGGGGQPATRPASPPRPAGPGAGHDRRRAPARPRREGRRGPYATPRARSGCRRCPPGREAGPRGSKASSTAVPGLRRRTAEGSRPGRRPRCAVARCGWRRRWRRAGRTWVGATSSSTKPATSPETSSLSAAASSDQRRARRAAGSSIPAVPPRRTQRWRASSVPVATWSATRAPRE